MPNPFKPVVLTANHLLTGAVVYFDRQGHWTTEFRSAQIFHNEKLATAALENALPSEIVGAYLAPVHSDNQNYKPAHFREHYRAHGPSIAYNSMS